MKKLPFAPLVPFLFLVACGGSGQMTGPGSGMMDGPGAMGVAFMSVSPQGGMMGVSTTTPLIFRFGGPMGVGMEQYFDLHMGDLAGPTVPMTCGWSADRTTLTCNPAAPLELYTTYTIHMGGGLTDGNGRPGGYDTHGPMMGSGWRNANGSYGMVFTFTTA
jgi:hypothetical protein